MIQFEDLVCHVIQSIKGTLKFEYQGREIDFTKPWKRLSVYDGIKEFAKIDPQNESAVDDYLKTHGEPRKNYSKMKLGEKQISIFELSVEPEIWNPVFVMDHPVEISPLTKIHRTDSRLVERFEPFVAGMEIGNSYSELNDPEEQRARLKEQEAHRAVNDEAHPMDEDFLHAIETGMPPTGGVGIGMERLIMILTDCPSIRDIIFFPTMKRN